MAKDKDSPDFTDDLYERRVPEWRLVDTLLGGTRAMREAEREYLPQFPAEHDEVYEDRLSSATLYPAYESTLDGIVGTVFRKPPRLGEDARGTSVIENDLQNIDLRGTKWTVYVQQFLRASVHYGVAAIFVDMPAGTPQSRQEEEAMRRRPYWTSYTAPAILSPVQYTVFQGARILTEIRFQESATVPDGKYGSGVVLRVRRLFREVLRNETNAVLAIGPPRWELYEKREVERVGGVRRNRKMEYVLINQGAFDKQKELPVAIFGDVGNPPILLDLAYLNVKHWQQQSDFDSSLHICGVPILAARDRDETKDRVPVGKSTLIDLATTGDLFYVEPRGASLVMMRENLGDCKAEMRDAGLALAMEGTAEAEAPTTATEQLFQAGKRASRLAQIVQEAQDVVELALQYHNAYYGQTEGASVVMGASLDELTLTAEQLRILSDMADRDQLPIREVWSQMKRAGKLSEDFDVEAEEKKMQQAREEAMREERNAAQPPDMARDNNDG